MRITAQYEQYNCVIEDGPKVRVNKGENTILEQKVESAVDGFAVFLMVAKNDKLKTLIAETNAMLTNS